MGIRAEREFNLATTRYQPLVTVFVAATAGVLADHFVSLAWGLWIGLATAALIVWCMLRRRVGRGGATSCLLLAIAATSGAWHHHHWRLYRDNELGLAATEVPQPLCLEAIVSSSPRLRAAPPEDPLSTLPPADYSVFTVCARRVRDGTQWREVSGRLRVTIAGGLIGVRTGDRVRIFGMFVAPTPPLNPGEFDFAASLRRERMLCRMTADATPCVRVVQPASVWNPRAMLYACRDRGDAYLWNYLHRERAGLAAAVLLGIREQVDAERLETFMTTGTVHLLAISGLHVGMLASGFWMIARLGWLSRRQSLCTAIGLVVFYALLTDARPPVTRAAVLICVMCVARLSGRRAFEFNTLALAGLLLLMINPSNVFQTGTQLSFLAVATLSCSQSWYFVRSDHTDPLERLIAHSRPWPIRMARHVAAFFWHLWLVSTVIWIIALPLVMYRFHLVSPISMVLNPIVWIPMGIALFAGFGVLMFGGVLPPLAVVCGWICDQSLSFIELCATWGATLPGSHVWIPAPPCWWVVMFYFGLAVGLAVPRLRPPRAWRLAIVAAWFAIGFAFSVGPVSRWESHRAQQLVCTFVAVGHGTSVLVELPGGSTLLYDAGSLGTSRAAVQPIAALLWSRGVTHLDAVVISHADADHYNALPGLLERFSVGVVYVSPLMFRESTPALDALREAIVAAGVPLRELDASQMLRPVGGVEFDILHPLPGGVVGSDNANSIVLSISYQGRTILLPGDLESPGLEDVTAELPLDCDIVMAPHHGSPRSNPRGFSAWTTPEVVVMSGGHGRDLSPAKTAYELGGSRVWHTAVDGAIRVEVSAESVQVMPWRMVQPRSRIASLPQRQGKERQ